MPEIFKRAAARRDLIEHYVYLAESGGEDLADRFLVCAEKSFADLGAQPEIGLWCCVVPNLQGFANGPSNSLRAS